MVRNGRGRAKSTGRAPDAEDAPTVDGVVDAMEPGRAEIVSRLREIALELEGTDERTVYDGFFREWTPAVYVGARQLFHVHNFRSGLRATVFVGVSSLEPVALHSDEVSPAVRENVAATSGRTVKQVKFPLEGVEDIGPLMELVRLKWLLEVD